jgi:ubiquinone/menaquinone biosynthesis C-methylase UbiE
MSELLDIKADLSTFYNSDEYDTLRGYANQEKQSFQGLFERIVCQLPKNATVLDWGCGNAQVIHRFLPKSEIAYLGVDIAYRQIEMAASKNPEHRYLLADFTQYSFSQNRYDLIVMRNSFQQVPSALRESVLLRAHSYLKMSGFILIAQTMKDLQKEPHCLPILEFVECKAFFSQANWEIENQLLDHKTKTWLIIAKKQEPSVQ